MASYVTVQDIKDYGVLPHSYVDEFELNPVTSGMLLKIASGVSALADSYCQKRHETPFDINKVPEAVKYHVVQIVCHKVLLTRGYDPNAGVSDTLVKANADESMQWLRDVSKGYVEIPRDADKTPEVDEMGSFSASDSSPYSFIDQQAEAFYGPCGC